MAVLETHLADLRHRVANDLALVAAVLERQRRRNSTLTADQAIDDAQGAILTLAQLYRDLYVLQKSDFVDLTRYLGEIVETLRQCYLNRLGILVSLKVEAVGVPPEAARDLGLVMTELVGNAAKHAFGGGGGSVEVTLRDCERGLVCRIADDGVGCSPDHVLASTGGLGAVLRLASNLGGWIEMVPAAEQGAAFELVIPPRQRKSGQA